MAAQEKPHLGFAAKIVKQFLVSKLSILFVIASVAAGVIALLATPREEDPQIVVPMADIFVSFPGASAKEVENLVATNLEKRLWEISGVEHVYSMSRPGQAIVTVRFYVGQDWERSIVKLYNKIQSNIDAVPPGVTGWLVRPVEIDDVPFVTFTLYSDKRTGYGLRRVADEVVNRLQAVPNSAKATVFGGYPRQILVYLDAQRLGGYNLSPLQVMKALRGVNTNLSAGSFAENDREIAVEAGGYLTDADAVGKVVVGVYRDTPVYLRDVATVKDGPAEPTTYTYIGFGPGAGEKKVPAAFRNGREYAAVTIAIAKRKGTNAVTVAEGLIAKLEGLKGEVIPDDIETLVTRNYGETANDKVNELIKHLSVAVVIIVVLIALALGPREALIVALAVPMTLAFTLLGDLIVGYTINRVTLFALILSLGLLVDDPIVDVENISRHYKLKLLPPLEATLVAVDEVRPPTILATLTVIMSFLPMFFITGMMGPYMRPMPFNISVAMIMSLVVAFTVTPWATYHLLKGEYGKAEEPYDVKKSLVYRMYQGILRPLLRDWKKSYIFLGLVVLAVVGSMLLAFLGLVPMKMLPFDNKPDLQIVIDMPKGTTLEDTEVAARELGLLLQRVPEVTDYETYVGTASPMDFNGMVRHYYLRQGPNVGEVRINLLPKRLRVQRSHELALRIRPQVEEIGRRLGANLKIVELPPGPPVFSTLVGEVYGSPGKTYEEQVAAAKLVRAAFEKTKGVVDVDDTSEADEAKYTFVADKEKIGIHGITVQEIAEILELALKGTSAGIVHLPTERAPLDIVCRLPRPDRSSIEGLQNIFLRTTEGNVVQLRELGKWNETIEDKTIYHKDLRRVVFVTGEMAGRSPVNAVINLFFHFGRHPLPEGFEVAWRGEGEWGITVDVFRDLGIAFFVALMGIYVLLVAQTRSLLIPAIIMISIPLTMIGIMPGFYLLNLVMNQPVAGYASPVFFTATGMIGMIALAGIVVRNSIILIDFIHHIVAREKIGLEDAIVEAGATRLRPILLTAGSAMFGSWIITLDPIFSGLAWSFIFGIFASTLFTLIVVPVVYYLIFHGKAETEAMRQA